ncbi:MAG: iron-sulfur cluster assembly scaffold protein [candidate division Zixibacteria bacterium]|nr:iron-sulfur cluster assembly scaffold protein [candidate division Zixibacteria bacterium]
MTNGFNMCAINKKSFDISPNGVTIATMYNKTVMDHFENPRNIGEIADADGVAVVGNPECGDMMKLCIKVVDGKLVDIKYKTFGCAAAIATSSIASEIIIGQSLDDAAKLTSDDIVSALGNLPEKKVHCSTLFPVAIQTAIEDYHNQKS